MARGRRSVSAVERAHEGLLLRYIAAVLVGGAVAVAAGCAEDPPVFSPENAGITPPLEPDRRWPGARWDEASRAQEADFADLHAYLFPGDGTDSRGGRRTDGAVVVQGGRIVYEAYGRGYDRDMPHHAWSIAKVVTSALVGIALRDGLVRLDDPLARFYPELAKDPRGAIRIEHLLHFGSGLDWNEGYEIFPFTSSILTMLYTRRSRDASAYILAHPLAAPPGERLAYNGADPTLLMAVLQRAMPAERYAEYPWRELFETLGMRGVVFGRDDRGVFIGSTNLYLTPRDLARFGYLYLCDGVWQGRRILPDGWVKRSTALAPNFVHSRSPLRRFARVGVGMQWWLNSGNPNNEGRRAWPAAPRDAFASTGHWGQRLFVVPSQDLVAVRFGDDAPGSFDSDRFLELVLRAARAAETDS